MNLSKVEDIVAAFESAQRRGELPAIRSLVDGLAEPDFAEAVVELVRSDIEYRWEQGLAILPPDEYQRQFPEVFSDSQRLAEIAFEDFRQRRQHGESCDPTEDAIRLGLPAERWRSGSDSDQAPGKHLERPSSRSASGQPCEDHYDAVVRCFPDFRLRMELGRGAAGRVYLATQGDLAERLVVIKVTQEPNSEPRQLARLQHTNIVPIYSLHRSGTWQVVCMPFLGHVTLADVLRFGSGERAGVISGQAMLSTVAQQVGQTIREKNQALPWVQPDQSQTDLVEADDAFAVAAKLDSLETGVWLAKRIAAGLAHAHRRGIVHSDLKPSNVLLGQDGEPRILDFHLAHQAAGDAAPWIGGTLDYMSSDHLDRWQRGDPPDAACDLFAFGVMLYQLLCGRLPFAPAESSSPAGIARLRAAREMHPLPPSRVNRLVTRDLDAIALKCLTPVAEERYASLEQVEIDLQRHLDHWPPQYARTWAPREHFRKWLRRNRWVRSTGFVAALSLGGLAAVASWFGFREQKFRRADAANQFEIWQQTVGETEARLASAGYGGDDVVRQIESALGWLQTAGFRAAELPAWSAVLPAEHVQRLRAAASRLEMLVARGYREASWGAEAAAAAEWRAAAQRHHRQAVELLGAQPPPLALQWQTEQLLSATPTADRLSEAERFNAWLQLRQIPLAGLKLAWPEQRLLAFEKFAAGDDGATIAMLETGLVEHSTDLAAWIVLGHAYARQRQFERAEGSYLVAHTLQPESALPRFYRGLVRFDAGKYTLALQDFQEAIELDDANPIHWANRALCWQALGKLPEAVADCDRAIELGIRQTRLYLVRARLHQALGNVEAAERDRTAGLTLRPSDELSWVARGFAKAATDPAGAVADFAQALRINPRSASALESSAAVYFDKLHDSQAALDCMTRLIQAQPTQPRHYANRGVLQARLGQVAAANQDADAALARGQDADTLFRVAGIYAQLASKDPQFAGRAVVLLRKSAFASPAFLWKRLAVEDPDLQPLQTEPEFQELRKILEKIAK